MPNYGNGSPGNPLPKLSFQTTDDALVTIGNPTDIQGPNATATFTDLGFLPVAPESLAGTPLHLPAWADGLFFQYTSEGVQSLYNVGTESDPKFVPTTATYTELHYRLVAYRGTPTFEHGADGTPTVSGISKQAVVAEGDLIPGGLGADPTTHNILGVDPTTQNISGDVLATMQIGNRTIGNLDITVTHDARDVGAAPSGFTLSKGTVQATFTPLTAPDEIQYTDVVTNISSQATAHPYSGPVDYLQKEFIIPDTHSVAMTANTPNVFLKGNSGDDALKVLGGSNVLDGSGGSNFLIGGTGVDGGSDTFFVDGRGGGVTWSTIGNFHQGDQLTFWGFVPNQSTQNWVESDGVAGYQGLTLHSELGGAGTGVNASATLAGLTSADLSKLTITTGTVGGNNYMLVQYTG